MSKKKLQPNRGVLFEPIVEEDYVFGASPIKDNITMNGDWTPFLVRGERQRKNIETMACVTFSACSIIEVIFNYMIANGMISVAALVWLEENGYLVNGELNVSDRFTATTSYTSKDGNTGKRVGQAIHEVGLIPESSHPFLENFTWKEYYSMPDPELFDLALEWKKHFKINYEVVHRENFKQALKHSPLQVYLYAWNGYKDGIYIRTENDSTHAVKMYKEGWYIFDTYEKYQSYVKQLAPDFKFSPIGYKYIVTEKNMTTNVKILKDADSNTVGCLLPAINSSALKSMGANYGIHIPEDENGDVDFNNLPIDGEYELR